MAFVNRISAVQHLTEACNVHAESNGWNLSMSIVDQKYYWKQESWWKDMVWFIMTFKVDGTAINKWTLFDKMDIGIIMVSPSGGVSPSYVEAGILFRQYMVRYLGSERLK
jgi:hypothetical protein